jgi:hypothetical protein
MNSEKGNIYEPNIFWENDFENFAQKRLLRLLIFKPKLIISPDANGGFGLTH